VYAKAVFRGFSGCFRGVVLRCSGGTSQKIGVRKGLFLAFLEVLGEPHKVVTKIRGVAMSRFHRYPCKSPTLRGFPGVSVYFGPQIDPSLAAPGLWPIWGPK